MDPFEPSDLHRVNAAQGWLMLGLPAEAHAELRELTPGTETHPHVLDLQWQAFALQANWAAAFAIAEVLVRQHPGSPAGWIHRAYAARRMPGGGIERAFALLRPAADTFPDNGLIPYNLACYCAQENRLDDAWKWYRQARSISNPAELRTRALADDDLRPLWPMISQLLDPEPKSGSGAPGASPLP